MSPDSVIELVGVLIQDPYIQHFFDNSHGVETRKQLCMDMTVITKLYCQLYIKCQLHVSANTIFGHTSRLHPQAYPTPLISPAIMAKMIKS